jgi:hypothetical protein
MPEEKFKKPMRIVEEPSEGIKARTILWYLTFFGFAINYVVRKNLLIFKTTWLKTQKLFSILDSH